MGLFRSDELLGIAAETLEFILSASEQTHPNEYMGFLRADDAGRLDLDRDGNVITDVLVIPGTESGPTSASVKEMMRPNDIRSVGSVHSHPNGVLRPSDADLRTFSSGRVHIIVGAPYGRSDWQAFDNQGEPTDLDVIDVSLPDEEFFELTQESLGDEHLDQPREKSEDDDSGGLFSWFR
ncbi:proteasome protein [Halovenus sp. WSH3]|uniref:Proteasome protein n=1 Tax=Halovenus carboxidivorans TaxID=2692199 RepID=A0A6B0SXV8_9EURY|nr:Mov34/MPN/PAD-1 family protein [Halovenus carboxidivorans]MXR50185.1 proteasome protein [Halovenus carboxidivorans]